ncbi:MAG: cysteine--tRNA ligase [Oceanococcus sp.]
MLRIQNSLTGKKETFVPSTPGQVGLYVCGVTVYDYCHLGHARFLLVFDAAVRHMEANGLVVNYVRNITDVDDKIITRAQENKEEPEQLTQRFIQEFHNDCDALGLRPADSEPKATLHMPQIIAMVQRLIDNGHAYAANNGDVYFSVSSFAEYGRLSGKRLDELRIGARIAPDEAKRDALDFVLWKAAKAGEPAWASPWGDGRPGWHIECSAMSTHCLGDDFDIHGGGMDLKFPHHENEIAQSVCATGGGFAGTWMHNGFVQVGSEKMSKSLGNFSTIRDLLKEYSGEVIRGFILGTHYRSPLTYTTEVLDAARQSLQRWYAALDGLELPQQASETAFTQRFVAAMDDDFNTPQAYAVLHEMAKAVNVARSQKSDDAAVIAAEFKALAGRLGLLQDDPQTVLKAGVGLDVARIEELIAQRVQAKADKNWALADQVRAELTAAGIAVEDGPDGTTWRRA